MQIGEYKINLDLVVNFVDNIKIVIKDDKYEENIKEYIENKNCYEYSYLQIVKTWCEELKSKTHNETNKFDKNKIISIIQNNGHSYAKNLFKIPIEINSIASNYIIKKYCPTLLENFETFNHGEQYVDGGNGIITISINFSSNQNNLTNQNDNLIITDETKNCELLTNNKDFNEYCNFKYICWNKIPPLFWIMFNILSLLIGVIINWLVEKNDANIYNLVIAIVIFLQYLASFVFDIFTDEIQINGSDVIRFDTLCNKKYLYNNITWNIGFKLNFVKYSKNINDKNKSYELILSKPIDIYYTKLLYWIYKLGLTTKIYNIFSIEFDDKKTFGNKNYIKSNFEKLINIDKFDYTFNSHTNKFV